MEKRLSPDDNLYLGVDISTQGIKVLAINSGKLEVTYECSVKFDEDLPEFKTDGGVHAHADGVTFTTPTAMFLKGMDLLLGKMKDDDFAFSKVIALSGTGQQHSSVYWKRGTQEVLNNLDPNKGFYDQLKDGFSVKDSPTWMDLSTTYICQELETTFGGAQKVADATGARATERYTGIQISKIYRNQPEAYANTERISVVSSFGASLFIGDYAPFDQSDGSGTHLFDINKKVWNKEICNILAPDLIPKLGDIIPAYEICGGVSRYLVERYGFSTDCKVVTFTGDNPASLAGMRLNKGEAILSMGTSDTVILWVSHPTPGLHGVIFVNPVDSNAYMALICFINGSLTREKIRDQCAEGSWEKFSALLKETPTGNNGNIGMYFHVNEIQPSVQGVFRFNAKGEQVSSFSAPVEARAVIEGQMMARRLYAERLGLDSDAIPRILVTGGASSNPDIIQIVADVFGSPVYSQDVSNSTTLGCAYRAKHGLLGGSTTSFSEVVKDAPTLKLTATPNPSAKQVYAELIKKYRELEGHVAQQQC